MWSYAIWRLNYKITFFEENFANSGTLLFVYYILLAEDIFFFVINYPVQFN